ncbi:hypothetical protein [Dyadobacter frigoris]|uniref:Uncharacterized protein n=1 Tax=Dyadobacter frigoris TaxID=2576211 RepID=A0A4U6CJR6_9BACT|nr:hypothetical protein [Dyadobacter frigoris]TKT84440.1 hypothetical protein FDK13_35020 [Dyadobacter frigoris]GLU51466.1 hypothetical protein Dfri01_09270 [Dyadobacter frigoris]
MDLYLHAVIYQIIADLENASIHYIIYARYFFFGQQMFGYEPVYLNKNSVRDVSLSEDSLRCRMMLDAGNSEESFSILIPFDFIREIKKVSGDSVGTGQTLFLQGKMEEVDSFYTFKKGIKH